MPRSLTCGVHHVGLSVPDLELAVGFFRDALGWTVVGRLDDYPAAVVSDETVIVTLWRVSDPASASPFDRHRNVGLHHLALAVPDVPALLELYERVAAHPGVTIEFEPGPVAPGTDARHFICRMPGDLRIEFIPRG